MLAYSTSVSITSNQGENMFNKIIDMSVLSFALACMYGSMTVLTQLNIILK